MFILLCYYKSNKYYTIIHIIIIKSFLNEKKKTIIFWVLTDIFYLFNNQWKLVLKEKNCSKFYALKH